jgi:sterol desaturase/sphingolipid hydroxylase (fatty acid hydroxylase superfamily)
VYPTLLIGSLLALAALLRAGVSLAVAPYAAAAGAGALLLVAERLLPYRRDWRPATADLVDDSLFLLLVQLALPLGLMWLTAWGAQRVLGGAGIVLGVWPQHWPIAAQLVAKIVLGDFLRYWLHRAAHTWTPLWRLHAVHHQPEKLYTTNVFRFHPAEKTLQFLCDTLPFVLLGIGPDVLAYYFVFYSVSGLLQHCDCDIRLGWLNYLVSGPEVHRWHHSRRIEESNNNYAHSFVVWDLVFGTYFRPRGAAVDRLGLLAPDYPRRFLNQLGAPFLHRAPAARDDAA